MVPWLRPRKAAEKQAPANPSPGVQAALALAQAGSLDGAETALRRCLEETPDDVHALMALGNVLFSRGFPAEALAQLRKVLAIDPGFLLARVNAVQCLRALGRYDAAIEECHELLERDPAGQGAALLARCLDHVGRASEAETAYLSAIDLAPADATLWCDYGAHLHSHGGLEKAEDALRRALEINPTHLPALVNLSHLLIQTRRHREAEVLLQHAASQPDFPPEVWANQALLRMSQNRLDEAFGLYDKALAAGLVSPEMLFSRSLLLLLSGRLMEGFAEFEHRFGTRMFAGTIRSGPGQPWRGESLAGRSILLWPEQGMGDTLQFVRYVPRLAALGAQVILEAQTPLVGLLAGSVPARVVRPGTAVGADFHCPLMSLPHRIGPTAVDPPWDGPYIRSAARGSAVAALAAVSRPRVGLVWSGNPSHPNDANRSIPFSELAPLLAVPGVSFCSLQFGTAAAECLARPDGVSWTNLAPLIDDFSHTAAVLSELDLLITVDTSVAHLAGAMGRPAWVLLPFNPDWRWQMGREDTPWYPSLRLLRQREFQDWAPVMHEAAGRLADFRVS